MINAKVVVLFVLLALPALPGVVSDAWAQGPNAFRPDETIAARNERIEEAIDGWGGDRSSLFEAHAELRWILTVTPDDAWAFTQLARAECGLGYRSADQYDPNALLRAETLAARALALDPQHLPAYLTAADVGRYQGGLLRARRLLAEARALDPRSPFVPLALAHVDRAEGKLDAALGQYRALIEAHPDSARVLYGAYRGMALIHGQRQESALEEAAFLNALRLQPDSPWAMSNYAGALLTAGKYDQAIEHATAALERMDFGAARTVLSEAYFRKGWGLFELRQHEEALAYFKTSAQANPDNPVSYFGFGAYFAAKAAETRNPGDALDLLVRAEHAYRHALTLSPGDASIRTALRRVLVDQQRLGRTF